MRTIDKLIKDYKDHGYQVLEKDSGRFVFETDKDHNEKHNKFQDSSPVFDGEFEGNNSQVTITQRCGHCHVNLDGDRCPKCKRQYKINTRKPHIGLINKR
jgi:hypothetical protein